MLNVSFYCRSEEREPIFNKGQSKRLWNELYKVNTVMLPWLQYMYTPGH